MRRSAIGLLVTYAALCCQASAQSGTTTPSITPGGVVPVNSTVNIIQPGEWVSIYGTNLASSTVTWTGNFPTSLGGSSVKINGKAAYLWYVSPTQINAQAPNDTATGPVSVVVTTASGSASSTVTLEQFAPSFSLLDARHVAGIILRSNGSGTQGGGSYDILGPTGSSLGYATVAAKPGDIVELFGVGFGPTNPPVPAGQVFSGAAPTNDPVNLLINNVSVTPAFAGLSEAGLFQITFTVPANLGTGDLSLVATVGGAQTPLGVVISVQASQSSSCANVAGPWIVTESGSYTETITEGGQTATQTTPINGTGNVLITQTGCSIQYNPISETGLIGSDLTLSQQASLIRSGTIIGNNVSVTGLLALIDTVANAQAGINITNISGNLLTGSGQVTGNIMTLNQTASLVVSGTYSAGGQSGPFTETITTSSTAIFQQSGIITTVAGSGAAGYLAGGFSGDGGLATSARLSGPTNVVPDASGNLFIADTYNQRIRKVSANGIITTVAGDGATKPGTSGQIGTFSGDGGPATSAGLSEPVGVAVDTSGNLFIADDGNGRIRKVATSGIITTVAGNGCCGFSGDGGPATSASLDDPNAVAVDASGNLFIADTYNNRIRKVSPNGIITTVAGSGTAGFSGDGGPATSAALIYAERVAVDASDNLFIVDDQSYRIRYVSASSGIITTIAGDGGGGFSGDGGLATLATLDGLDGGVAVDASGNLLIADSGNNRIRKVSQVGAASAAAAPANHPAHRIGVQFRALATGPLPLNIVISPQ